MMKLVHVGCMCLYILAYIGCLDHAHVVTTITDTKHSLLGIVFN
jgi:hypothetical protein